MQVVTDPKFSKSSIASLARSPAKRSFGDEPPQRFGDLDILGAARQSAMLGARLGSRADRCNRACTLLCLRP